MANGFGADSEEFSARHVLGFAVNRAIFTREYDQTRVGNADMDGMPEFDCHRLS